MSNSNLIDIRNIVQDWYRDAVERRELLAMEDRALRDIGITRVDAIAAATSRRRRAAAARHPAPPAPLRVDPETIQRHIENARVLRARAMADFARAAMRWLSGRTVGQPKARIRKLAPVAR